MVIFTAKLNKKRLIAMVLIAAVLIAAVILAVPNKEHYGADNVLGSARSSEVKGIKTNEDRLSYILSMGYTVTSEPISSREVMIPKEFDETYEKYNQMQQEAGFDLESYQGKQVMLYTYEVTGYEGAEGVQLELLIYKEKIIGGSVYTVALDGFMRGLLKIG